MTKIILDKIRYDDLIKIEEDFDLELDKAIKKQDDRSNRMLDEYKDTYMFTIWMLGIVVFVLLIVIFIIKGN